MKQKFPSLEMRNCWKFSHNFTKNTLVYRIFVHFVENAFMTIENHVRLRIKFY